MPTQRLHAWLDAGTPVPGPSGQPRVIHDEGVPLPVREVIDMRGTGVTATDDAAGDRTVITIPGLTPWTQNVDAALYDLNSVGVVRFGPYTGAPGPDAGIGNEAGTLHILTDNGGSVNIESFGNGRVMVSTDGTRRLVVHQNGNAGIGPSMNPAYTLDVQGDVNSSGVYRVNGQPHTHAYTDLTGKPSSFPPAAHTHPWGEITGIPSNVSSAVPDTTQIIAGTGLSGGGPLTGNVTLSANIAGIQTPWLQDIEGSGKALNNGGRIRGTRFESGVTGGYTGNVTYDGANWRYVAGGCGMLLWADTAAPVFYTAPAGTTGAVAALIKRVIFSDSGITDIVGNVPGGCLQLRQTEAGGYLLAGFQDARNAARIGAYSGSWRPVEIVGASGEAAYFMNSNQDGYVSIGFDAANNRGKINCYNPAGGGWRTLVINEAGSVQMFLGGSLKTLSVDGSGFVKAA